MAGGIPEEVLTEIQDRCDIAEVIGGYIPLKRAGRNFKGLCPFHHEKTPSFVVNPDKQIYHCFGCGVGGNVFNFLMRYERLEFPEAVDILARQVGVTVPKRHEADPQTVSLNQKLYQINELAADFYNRTLTTAPEASEARSYLTKRQIDAEAIRKFKLGFALERWDSLLNYLRSKGISLGLIEKAGLSIGRDDKSGYYDRFRKRIIFPICDARSRVIGFGARVLDDTLPKYINSPETPIYSKGKSIFGLNSAKDAVRNEDCVAIVEGYLDCIAPQQAGVENIVASLGTALTSDQIKLLRRYTHNVVLIFDPDAAGELATLRSLDVFIEEDMYVKVVALPQGCDPDSFVHTYGADELRRIIRDAQNLYDYKVAVLAGRRGPETAEGKAYIAKEMLATISLFQNEVLKSTYMKQLAEFLDVKEESLFLELKKVKDVTRVVSQPPVRLDSCVLRPAEKMLVKLLIEEKGFVKRFQDELQIDDFQDARIRQFIQSLCNCVAEGKDISPDRLATLSGDDVIGELIAALCASDDLHGDHERVFCDCVKRLRQDRIKMRSQQLCSMIKKAEDSGDKGHLSELIEEYNSLKRGVEKQ